MIIPLDSPRGLFAEMCNAMVQIHPACWGGLRWVVSPDVFERLRGEQDLNGSRIAYAGGKPVALGVPVEISDDEANRLLLVSTVQGGGTTFDPCGLHVLANRWGTDKLWAHHYIDEYVRHFEPHRHKAMKLLEIGVGGYSHANRGGESLGMWRDYMPNAAIHGLDFYDKSGLKLGDRITIHKGDQSSPESLTELNAAAGPFDIIVDDGSHIQSHILTSFFTLFPLLNPAGIYVIEDLETAYKEDHEGHPNLAGKTSVGLIQTLVDGLHWRFWKGRGPTPIDRMVKSIHVSHELVFIYKQG